MTKMSNPKQLALLVSGSLFFIMPALAETITLKSGKTIEGNILERTDKYLKVDFRGMKLTYDIDEVERIEGEILQQKADLPATVVEQEVISAPVETLSEGQSEIIDPNYDEFKNSFEKATKYFEQDEFDLALKEYDKAIQISPNKYPNVYLNRGLIYALKNDFDKALQDYNEAIRLDPRLTEAYSNRGQAYYQLKRYNDAVVDANKAVELAPENASSYMNRSIAYFGNSEYEKSLADLKKAESMGFPVDDEFRYILGQALMGNNPDDLLIGHPVF